MPSLMSALTRKFLKSRSAPRPSVLLAVVKKTVLSVNWFIDFLLLRMRVLGHHATTRAGLLLHPARGLGDQPSLNRRVPAFELIQPIFDRALLARSAHNLVVEAVDLRLDTTTPPAGPFVYP